MRLWTIQHYKAYEHFIETGVLRADEEYMFCKESFYHAYKWMGSKMTEYGLVQPKGVRFPVWAWFQWEGKRKQRDIHESGYSKRGEKMVQLTVEADDRDILLSDFDLFHYVINKWYLPLDENDDLEFENCYQSAGYSFYDLNDTDIHTKEMEKLRLKIVSSWDRIFMIEREDNGWLYGKNCGKTIQAVFWELNIEQVVKAEVFTAR